MGGPSSLFCSLSLFCVTRLAMPTSPTQGLLSARLLSYIFVLLVLRIRILTLYELMFITKISISCAVNMTKYLLPTTVIFYPRMSQRIYCLIYCPCIHYIWYQWHHHSSVSNAHLSWLILLLTVHYMWLLLDSSPASLVDLLNKMMWVGGRQLCSLLAFHSHTNLLRHFLH